mgnify:FL=1
MASKANRSRMTRYDAGPNQIEAAFDVELSGQGASMAALVEAVQALSANVRCLVVDQPAKPIE